MRHAVWLMFVAPAVAFGGCSGDDDAKTLNGDASTRDVTESPDSGDDEGGCGSNTCETLYPGSSATIGTCPALQCEIGTACDAVCCVPKTPTMDCTDVKHSKLIAVHASAFAPSFRFCFAIGVKADGSDGLVGPLPALPHDDSNLGTGTPFPALYPGAGGAFPDLTDLEPKALTPILIPMPNAALASDVKSNINERTCDTLVGSYATGGVLNPIGADGAGDFFKRPTIPAGTFVKGHTYLLALTGCMPGNTTTGAALQCGPTYDAAVGNLAIKIVQLDKTVADPTKMGLQALDLSQAIDGVLGATLGGSITNIVGITLDDLDGGSPPNAPVATTMRFGSLTPLAVPQTYASTDYPRSLAYDTIVGTSSDGGTIPPQTFALPFGTIQTLTYGYYGDAGLPGPAGSPIYAPGANYTLVLLGDPSAQQLLADGGPNASYDGRGIHFLMFPNDPPLPPL